MAFHGENLQRVWSSSRRRVRDESYHRPNRTNRWCIYL